MPYSAARPCTTPGCPELVRERGVSKCPKHHTEYKRTTQRTYDARRGTPAERGYDINWRRLRDAYIAENPLCEDCKDEGRTTAAEMVDHKETIKDAPWRRLDWSNLRSLCGLHHRRKTAARDGSFGNPLKGKG
jgi:5-methylcytosine-specific restriction enzyme A